MTPAEVTMITDQATVMALPLAPAPARVTSHAAPVSSSSQRVSLTSRTDPVL